MRTIAGTLAIASLLIAVPAAAVDRVVDDNLVPCIPGPLPIHRTVSDAVALAADGETIVVCPGTYPEAIGLFTSGLTVRGVGRVELVGPRPDYFGHGVFVGAVNATIEGLEISGFDGCGVYTDTAHAVSVMDNRVHHNGAGVCAWFTDDARVANNVVEANSTWGIMLIEHWGGEVTRNRVVNNGSWGIAALECARTPTIANNVVIGNPDGIVVSNGDTPPCDPVIRHNRLQGPGPTTTGDGIELGGKITNAVVTHNQVAWFGTGILFWDAGWPFPPAGSATFNRMTYNGIGIDVRGSDGLTLAGNYVSRSTVVDCRWDGYGVHDFDDNTCRTEQPPGTFE